VEFWLVWVAVDAVGVTTLIHAGYYPTAFMYLFYGGFCVWGFVAWARLVARRTASAPADDRIPTTEGAAA
jgi:nicotinamide mononucleotide transporter